MADKGSYVFSAAALLIGAGFFIAGSIFAGLGVASLSWATVEGTILITRGEADPDNPEDDLGPGEIRYQYEVDGQTYTNSRISYSTFSSDSGMDFFHANPRGPRVTVSYMRGKPGSAVLVPGISAEDIVFPGVGLIFALFGAGLIVRERRLEKEENSVEGDINRARKESQNADGHVGSEIPRKEISFQRKEYNKVGETLVGVFGVLIIGFCVTVSIQYRNDPEFLGLLAGAAFFSAIGLFMVLATINTAISRVHIVIVDRTVQYRMVSLIRRIRFEENIGKYSFIVPRREVERESFGSRQNAKKYRMVYARLIHRDNRRRDVKVRLSKKPYSEHGDADADYARIDRFAKELGLPVRKFPVGSSSE